MSPSAQRLTGTLLLVLAILFAFSNRYVPAKRLVASWGLSPLLVLSLVAVCIALGAGLRRRGRRAA